MASALRLLRLCACSCLCRAVPAGLLAASPRSIAAARPRPPRGAPSRPTRAAWLAWAVPRKPDEGAAAAIPYKTLNPTSPARCLPACLPRLPHLLQPTSPSRRCRCGPCTTAAALSRAGCGVALEEEQALRTRPRAAALRQQALQQLRPQQRQQQLLVKLRMWQRRRRQSVKQERGRRTRTRGQRHRGRAAALAAEQKASGTHCSWTPLSWQIVCQVLALWPDA